MPLPPGYKLVPQQEGGNLPPGYQLVEKAPEKGFIDEATDALGAAWKEINPWEQLKGMYDLSSQVAQDPVGVGKALLDAQGNLAVRAKTAFETGDYLGGLRHSLGYLVPLLGPAVDEMGNEIAAGKDVGKNIGKAIGTGLGFKIPGVMDIPALAANPNAATAAALGYLQSKGIQVPAGTASGSKFWKGVQKGTAHTPLGAVVADRAQNAAEERLSTLAGELADTTHPQPQTALLAGGDVRTGLQNRAESFSQRAGQAYDVQRQAEADPRHTRPVQQGFDAQGNPIIEDVPMPVDISQLQAVLRPIQAHMMQWVQPALRNSSAGFQAVNSLLNAPRYIPASVAEAGLGGLKALSREDPVGRSGGLARMAMTRLQDAIDQTVGGADPLALQALQQGRQLTAAQHESLDTLRSLGQLDEGVLTHKALTAPNDTRITRLRDVAQQVPQEIPKIGRAYLEELFDKARAEGGFVRTDKLFSEWDKLGDETKEILFPNPRHRQDLNNFFLGAKKMAENPNPSGTALMQWINTLFTGGAVAAPGSFIGGGLAAGAVAKLMYSPRGVQLLTQGMRIPINDKVRAAAWTARAMNIVNEDVDAEKKLQEYLKSKNKTMLPYTYAPQANQ